MRLSLLTWLCTSLSAGLPRWSFIALLPLSCFRHVWHRFLGCQSLELFTLSFSLSQKLAGTRSATYNLATALLSARGQHSLHLATELLSAPGRASVCSGPCCESSSGSSVLHFVLFLFSSSSPRQEVSRMSAFHLGHFSCRTREANSACFRTEITYSSCN